MLISGDIVKIREERWSNPKDTWGFVPTMGYLHEGHLSLVRRARSENDRVAVSIYVNPTQFAPTEDLATYPRDLERDLEFLAHEQVDLVFTPTDATMYPPNFQTSITMNQLTKPLEGVARPNHFQGVMTVVAKLFNIIEPNKAYFGQKDAQQAVIIRHLVHDLNFNLEVIICPIIREPDGLAMSSRNVRLDPQQRLAAPILFKSLLGAVTALKSGQTNATSLRQQMVSLIQTEPLAKIDYVSIADPETLEELELVENGALFSLAVFFGKVRLIDNLLIKTTS